MSATLDTHSADHLQTVAARTATILHPAGQAISALPRGP